MAEFGLAEAYVLRKLHKEKMESERKKAAVEEITNDCGEKTSRKIGRFFGIGMISRIHPSKGDQMRGRSG